MHKLEKGLAVYGITCNFADVRKKKDFRQNGINQIV